MSTIGYINVSLETFGGLLSLIFIICLRIGRSQNEPLDRLYIRLLSCNTILLFCDAAAWLFKGKPEIFSRYIVHISNFLVFTLGYLMLLLFTHYLVSFLETKDRYISKIPLYLMCGLMFLAVCLTVISHFNHMYYFIDEQNIYHRQGWFWMSQMFGIAGMILNACLLFYHRSKMKRTEFWAFSIYICLPVAALLFQILFYSIAVLYLATTICLICIYINIQIALSREVSRKELELEKAKTAIMLSQIQPHFLYNALTGIKALCGSDPQKAMDAMEHFSYFLRSNLDSLTDTRLILFTKEIGHVKDYFYLEKMRFGDRVNLKMELDFQDFMLPPLTLQPIVENAVRYGITKKDNGGTVTIKSEKQDGQIQIIIRDDGVGFDVGAPKEDGRTHTGIENVRSRLEVQCGGSIKIQSEKGVGTVVRITLPGKEEKNETFGG